MERIVLKDPKHQFSLWGDLPTLFPEPADQLTGVSHKSQPYTTPD